VKPLRQPSVFRLWIDLRVHDAVSFRHRAPALAALVLIDGLDAWSEFLHVITAPRAIGSYRLSFGASLWRRPSMSSSASSLMDAGAL